ncbi:MAG: methyltransferase domain-containing protein [Rhodospirillales bacterium]
MNAPADTAQTWNAAQYRDRAGYVAAHGKGVVDLLAPRPGERILDVGCGDGTLTREIVDAGADVTGIDASEDQVNAARSLGIDARVADVCALDFNAAFDAVFSSAVLHWVRDAETAARNIARALKPGGRFVGEFGGAGNVKTVADALIKALGERGLDGMRAWPWYFPNEAEYTTVLEGVGFDVDHIELFDRPTPITGGLGEWIQILARPFLGLVDEAEVPALLKDAERHAAPALRDADGAWHVDYVRLRFAATRTDQAL